jgi:hypothetical protein
LDLTGHKNFKITTTTLKGVNMKAILATLVLGLALTANAASTNESGADATSPASQSEKSAPVASTRAPVATSYVAIPSKKVAEMKFEKECNKKFGKNADSQELEKCVSDMKKEAAATK